LGLSITDELQPGKAKELQYPTKTAPNMLHSRIIQWPESTTPIYGSLATIKFSDQRDIVDHCDDPISTAYSQWHMVVSSQNLQLTGKSQSPFAEVWMIFPGGSTPFFTRARI